MHCLNLWCHYKINFPNVRIQDLIALTKMHLMCYLTLHALHTEVLIETN